jgi:outer membrane murein-binding lipoprotein Lpp
MQILVGVLESYTPSDTVKDLHTKVEDLKQKMNKFMMEVVAPEMEQIQKIVDEENKKFMPTSS